MSHIPHCGCFIPAPLFHFSTPFLFLKNNPRFLTLGWWGGEITEAPIFLPFPLANLNFFAAGGKARFFIIFAIFSQPGSRKRISKLMHNTPRKHHVCCCTFFVWGKPALATTARLQRSWEWPVSHLSRPPGSAEGRPAPPHPLACRHPPCLPTISATCSELGTGTHSVMFTLFFRGSLS